MSIFPYIYFMIESFNITNTPSQIAVYAGMVTSAFAFAEFLASIFWGRLSDRVGRKPILLTGMAGTGISMIAFGFARNLPMALLARAMGGLLNGFVSLSPPLHPNGQLTWSRNIGVLQTTVAEVVTVEAHEGKEHVCKRNLTPQANAQPSKGLFYHAFCLVSWVGRMDAFGMAVRTNAAR